MTHKLFQGVLFKMKEGQSRKLGVCDETGLVVACTDIDGLGAHIPAKEELPGGEIFILDNKTFLSFTVQKQDDFSAFVEGVDEEAAHLVRILAIALENIKQYYDDKYDKTNFIKNVVTDNILPGDIYAKARELHFAGDVMRVVLLIRVSGSTDGFAHEAISTLFPEKQKDFVFNVSEQDTVLVKELKRGIESHDVDKLAGSIIDTLSSTHFIKASVGIGLPVVTLKDLATSFKEAQVSLEIGRVFDTERNIINYSSLGVARLIYQLPTTLCEMFLREVFRTGSIESLDAETLFTIQRFFENNLNVSETSRGLFVHRNTLVYRLEKIKKLTGLDLREFDDAILFKVALMVKKYLAVIQA